jgi:hypothetical protein
LQNSADAKILAANAHVGNEGIVDDAVTLFELFVEEPVPLLLSVSVVVLMML